MWRRWAAAAIHAASVDAAHLFSGWLHSTHAAEWAGGCRPAFGAQTASSSTSNSSVAFGGMTPPAP